MTRLPLPRMSFRSALMVAVLGPVFVVVAVALWVMSALDADVLRRHLVETAENIARIVGDYSSSDLAFNTPEESREALAMLGQDARVDAVALFDDKGELFSSWRRSSVPGAAHPSSLGSPVLRARTAASDDSIEVWRPIGREDERYGTIYLRVSTAEIDVRRSTHLATLGLLGLFLAALGVSVAYLAQHVVAEPVLRLSRAAEHIARHRDFAARVKPEGAREIRTLTASLNGMLTAIEQHQRERDAAIVEVGRHAETLEQRVHERTAALEASNRELEAFSYSVSHDLRAPLRAIQGFGRLLLDEQGSRLDPEGVDFAGRIMQAAERMDRLILDLLEYGRLGKKAPEVDEVDLDVVLDDARRQQADAYAERGAEIEIQAPLGRALGHHATLVQAFSNLLSNAVKFVEPGVRPSVRVQVTRNGQGVRLSVKDNGIGIAREHQERVFQLFERLHDSSKYAGTGVGLAIVKRAVERMGGQVGLQSEPGRGSTFWIELPGA
jgi:signal transduction histidine kinase